MTFTVDKGLASSDTSAPVMATLYFKDSFDRNDGAPGDLEYGGKTWIKHALTNWSIKSNILDSGDAMAITPADLWFDSGRKTGKIITKVLHGGAANLGGILFRRSIVATESTAWVFYGRDATTYWTLAKRTGTDSFTVVPRIEGLGSQVYFKSGQEGKVVLGPETNRIRCYVDDVLTHDIVDATYAEQTGVGLTTRKATADSTAKFDNFRIIE